MRDILEQVANGKTKFEPLDHDRDSLREFQRIANRIISAEKRGYLSQVVPSKIPVRGDLVFNHVTVIGGLTFEGEQFVSQLGPSSLGGDPVPMDDHTYDNIRKVILDIINRTVNVVYEPNQYEHIIEGVTEVFSRLEGWHDGNTSIRNPVCLSQADCDLTFEILNDLKREGIIVDGLNRDNPGPPFFRLAPKSKPMPKDQSPTKTEKLVFISHSSVDEDLADKLVDMLSDALHLRRSDFVCTSVEGSKLQGGANTDDVLRHEIREVPAFLSLLTPQSFASTYVLFELGARWLCEKHHIPLLAKGAETQLLKEPLKAKNALHLSKDTNVLQLVDNLASIIDRRPEPPNSYLKKVRAVVEVSRKGEIQEIIRLANIRLRECVDIVKAAGNLQAGIGEVRGFQRSWNRTREEVVVIVNDVLASHADLGIVGQPASNGWLDQNANGQSPYSVMQAQRRGTHVVRVVGHGDRLTALAFEQLENPSCMIVVEAHYNPY